MKQTKDALNHSTEELLGLYPEFKPLWKAAMAAVMKPETLMYYVRKSLIEHHEEITR